MAKPRQSAPPAPTPPAAGKTEKIKEEEKPKLPPKFVDAIKKAGYKEKDLLRMKSYDGQKLWRAVFTDGQRHEFSYEGVWLTKPKPKKEEKKKEEKKEEKE